MHKIEKEKQVESLPLHLRLKKQQMLKSVNSHYDQDEVDQAVERITKRNCQSVFKAQSRADVDSRLRNRTGTPAVGHYSPRWDFLDKKEKGYHNYSPAAENEGSLRKRMLNFQ